MPTVVNTESRRVFELVTAYEDRQITSDELQDGLRPVSAEALQVAVTFGSARDASLPGSYRLHSARVIARSMASAARCRC